MLKPFQRLRFVELQLLLAALLFFACGYLLTSLPRVGADFDRSARSLLGLLWPSSLPILLYVLISFILSWRLPRADQLILPLVALLSGLSLLLSARLKPSFDALYGSDYYGDVATKQSAFVLAGVILLLIMALAPLDRIFIRLQRMSFMDWLKNHRWIWITLGLALVAITLVFGEGPPGQDQKLWIPLGPINFQPSELLKVFLVIFLASYLDEHREVMSEVPFRVGGLRLPPLPHLLPMVAMWGATMAIIIIQRDLGAALLLFGLFLAMLYVATNRAWYVVAGLVAFAGGAYVLNRAISRVSERVSLWLDPWSNPNGFQPVQGAYAESAAGVFGTGLGQGVPAYVPAAHTDYAFISLTEELGLAGAIGILIVYLLLMYRGFHIALRLNSRFRGFEQLLAVGLTSIIAFQTFIIVGGNLRVIPLTGVTLPFVSYGGSSVLINFLIVGLLLRISATTARGQ
jgi:cell division protein FtsW (lipid II flippase)